MCEGGVVEFRVAGDARRVRLTRIHLEDDAGKNIHDDSGVSFVDFNRAGVPLVEIVSEPDIRSADEAAEYMRALRTLVRTLGISDGNMEEGSLRCDANVSLRLHGAEKLGTKAELKNINSFKHVREAIEHEIRRQAVILDRGEAVVQETRLWDPERGLSQSMRSKEHAHDYRYFPEPDLAPLVPDARLLAAAAEGVGPMPAERRRRLSELLKAGPEPAERRDGSTTDQVVTVVDLGLDELVHGAVTAGADPHLSLARAANEAAANPDAAKLLDPIAFAALLKMESSGQLSATQSKEVLAELMTHGGDPARIAASLGYEQMDTAALDSMVDDVIASNPEEWQRYRAGEEKVAQFLLGKVMRATKGRANGKLVAAAFAARRSV